jgi:hypothetical protein
MKLCDLINWFDTAIFYTFSLLGGIKPNPIKGVQKYKTTDRVRQNRVLRKGKQFLLQ